ncbi:MAG: hypothetical protein ABJC19_11225 [Gemmatimonadota bacterium]
MKILIQRLMFAATVASLVCATIPTTANAADGLICHARPSDGKCKIPDTNGCDCVTGD